MPFFCISGITLQQLDVFFSLFVYNQLHVFKRATPHCRFFNHFFLSHHLYHHTPLVEYILKHLYMYPRTLLFGSWDITHPYHHPYVHNCMQIHSYGYRYIHMHAEPVWVEFWTCICMHMYTSVSIRVYLHAVVCICTFNEDPLDACNPTAPVIIQQSRDSRGTNKQMVYDESHHPLIGVMYYHYFIIKRRMMLLDWGVVCLHKPVSYQYWKGGENKGNWMKQDDHWWSSIILAASPPPISTLSFVLLSFTTMRPMSVILSHHYHRHILTLAHRLHQRAVFLPDQHCIPLLQRRASQLLHVRLHAYHSITSIQFTRLSL